MPRLNISPDIPQTYEGLKQAYIDLANDYQKNAALLAWFQKQMFDQKRERFMPVEGQGSLDLGMEAPDPLSPITEHVSYERRKEKAGHGRALLPAHLPRVEEVIEPEGDRTGWVKIGEDVTEELEAEPGKYFVRRIVRPRYSTPDGRVVTGLLPPRPIPKGIPGPGLLAHMLVGKYVDHLPLYRQQQIYQREGIEIPRSTLGDWVLAMADLLFPLLVLLRDEVLSSTYVQADETSIKVQRDDAKEGKLHTGWMWVFHSPEKQIVVFEYSPSRSQETPGDFLAGFQGFLQSDAYAGYNEMADTQGVEMVGCWAHARRKFFEAQDNDRERAEQMLKWIKQLYRVEREAEDAKFSPEQRQCLRAEKSAPVLTTIKSWLETEQPKVLPKSDIGMAIAYSLKQWERLIRFQLEGRLEIDNNLVENSIRPVALGRKNWLFAGSKHAAECAAVIMTLAATCKRTGVEPFGYFKDVIARIPALPPDPERKLWKELLPAQWLRAKNLQIPNSS